MEIEVVLPRGRDAEKFEPTEPIRWELIDFELFVPRSAEYEDAVVFLQFQVLEIGDVFVVDECPEAHARIQANRYMVYNIKGGGGGE